MLHGCKNIWCNLSVKKKKKKRKDSSIQPVILYYHKDGIESEEATVICPIKCAKICGSGTAVLEQWIIF